MWEIVKEYEEKDVVLLHGVTGSGKTHLYISKIEETVASGKNVLMLFPEVALTKQITQRLEKNTDNYSVLPFQINRLRKG